MKLNTVLFARFALTLIFILMVIMFAGCRTKKTVVDKKETTVSEITKNDIKTTEAAQIETSVFTVTDSQKWSIIPLDKEKQVVVIKGKDTLKFTGATVNFDNSKTETATNILEQNSKDHWDNTTTSNSQKTTEKKKDQTVKSASWGLNLGIIFLLIALVCAGYLHFQKRS